MCLIVTMVLAGGCRRRYSGICGDGLLSGEACDDGNTFDGDGCSAVCTSVPPGGVYRAVESSSGTMPNEVSIGFNICDDWNTEGWVALCSGACDLTSCSNFLDYFEKAGSTSPIGEPTCATFTPGPLSVSGAGTSDSATRSTFSGGGNAGLQSDWVVAPFSRN